MVTNKLCNFKFFHPTITSLFYTYRRAVIYGTYNQQFDYCVESSYSSDEDADDDEEEEDDDDDDDDYEEEEGGAEDRDNENEDVDDEEDDSMLDDDEDEDDFAMKMIEEVSLFLEVNGFYQGLIFFITCINVLYYNANV